MRIIPQGYELGNRLESRARSDESQRSGWLLLSRLFLFVRQLEFREDSIEPRRDLFDVFSDLLSHPFT